MATVASPPPDANTTDDGAAKPPADDAPPTGAVVVLRIHPSQLLDGRAASHGGPPAACCGGPPAGDDGDESTPPTPSRRILNKRERDYMQQKMDNKTQRRVRAVLKRMACNRDSARAVDEPLRLSLLRSTLPAAYMTRLFHTLTHEPSDKNIALVREALRIPYKVYTSLPASASDPSAFLRAASDEMDRHIHGHRTAKREVLMMLAQWRLGGGGASSPFALGLEGAPGCGKTTFVKHALATAMGRPLATICLGGASDGSFLVGHGFAYEGSRHGRLVEALMQAKCNDPVLFFDELDKVAASPRGEEIINTLVHLTDPVTNGGLTDRYFTGLEIGFERCVVVFSYNDPTRISPVLLDRLKRLKLESPSTDEKVRIARDHLLPRLATQTHCSRTFTDEALDAVLAMHAADAGMRGIERSLHEVLSAAVLCEHMGAADCLYGAAASAPPPALDVLLPRDVVTRGFVERVLEDRKRALAPSGPPDMMFA